MAKRQDVSGSDYFSSDEFIEAVLSLIDAESPHCEDCAKRRAKKIRKDVQRLLKDFEEYRKKKEKKE